MAMLVCRRCDDSHVDVGGVVDVKEDEEILRLRLKSVVHGQETVLACPAMRLLVWSVVVASPS
jgi:hypothetical protein